MQHPAKQGVINIFTDFPRPESAIPNMHAQKGSVVFCTWEDVILQIFIL